MHPHVIVDRSLCRAAPSPPTKFGGVVLLLVFSAYRRERIQKRTFSPWGTPFNILYGEAPPETGTFFKFQVDEKVGISLVEVNERVMKSVIARKL